jgi:hypothetical protein
MLVGLDNVISGTFSQDTKKNKAKKKADKVKRMRFIIVA